VNLNNTIVNSISKCCQGMLYRYRIVSTFIFVYYNAITGGVSAIAKLLLYFSEVGGGVEFGICDMLILVIHFTLVRIPKEQQITQ